MSDTEWVLVPREPTEAMIRAGYSAPLFVMLWLRLILVGE